MDDFVDSRESTSGVTRVDGATSVRFDALNTLQSLIVSANTYTRAVIVLSCRAGVREYPP
jgi:hypothetical protein